MSLHLCISPNEFHSCRARCKSIRIVYCHVCVLVFVHNSCRCFKCFIKSSFSSRAETVRSALDVLAVCCVVPRVHNVFCNFIELRDDASAGINIILGAAEGEIVADAEVQKSALTVLVHIVCAPTCKVRLFFDNLFVTTI